MTSSIATLDVSEDEQLLQQVLRPYREHTSYLTAATVTPPPVGSEAGEGMRCEGSFRVPYSCYIDDTGHFNSVELNICFNQLLYMTLAVAVRDGHLSCLGDWTLEDFWRRQLPDILITDFHSTFRRSMSGRDFRGELSIDSAVRWRGADYREPMVVLGTSSRFWDEAGGTCGAEVRIAITEGAADAG